MADVDQLFSKMKDAPMFGRGNYMGEGVFEVEIQRMFIKHAFKGHDVFICEFTILQSNNPRHAVGSTGSWAPKIALPNTFGDIKSLIFSLSGRDPKTVPAEDAKAHEQATLLARAACGSDTGIAELKAQGVEDVQALVKGRRLGLECVQIKTQAGKDFTRYTWSPSKAA